MQPAPTTSSCTQLDKAGLCGLREALLRASIIQSSSKQALTLAAAPQSCTRKAGTPGVRPAPTASSCAHLSRTRYHLQSQRKPAASLTQILHGQASKQAHRCYRAELYKEGWHTWCAAGTHRVVMHSLEPDA